MSSFVVAYERRSLTRGSNYSDLTWNWTFCILDNWLLRRGGLLREWSQLEVQLYFNLDLDLENEVWCLFMKMKYVSVSTICAIVASLFLLVSYTLRYLYFFRRSFSRKMIAVTSQLLYRWTNQSNHAIWGSVSRLTEPQAKVHYHSE